MYVFRPDYASTCLPPSEGKLGNSPFHFYSINNRGRDRRIRLEGLFLVAWAREILFYLCVVLF